MISKLKFLVFTRIVTLVPRIQRGYDTVDGRRTFGGGVFPFLKGRQLRSHCSDSDWSVSTNRISITRITTAQIEIKLDLITKT